MLDPLAAETELQDIAPGVQPVNLEEPVSTKNLHDLRVELPKILKVLLLLLELREIMTIGKGVYLSILALSYIHCLMKLLKLEPGKLEDR